MTNIYYTGDSHYSHKNIIKYCNRPFKTVEEMDAVMIKNWNDVVKEGDTVYHVGDFGLGSYDKLKEIFDRLNGRKIIVRGNHDRSRTSLTRMGWEVYEQPFILDNIIITHNPIVDTHRWPIQSFYTNTINICGHVHDSWRVKGNSYNVGVDVWNFRPVSIKEILENKK